MDQRYTSRKRDRIIYLCLFYQRHMPGVGASPVHLFACEEIYIGAPPPPMLLDITTNEEKDLGVLHVDSNLTLEHQVEEV